MARHRHRHPRPPRIRRPDRATVIAALLFLLLVAGIAAALIWGRGDVATCYTPADGRWC